MEAAAAGSAPVAGQVFHPGGVIFTRDETVTRVRFRDPADQSPVRAQDEPTNHRVIARHASAVYAVCATPDGIIYSGGEDRVVRGYTASGDELFSFRGCPHPIIKVAASPDGKWVAASSADPAGVRSSLLLFDMTAARADAWRQTLPRAGSSGFVLAIDPTGNRFADVHVTDRTGEKPTIRIGFHDGVSGASRAVSASEVWSSLPVGAIHPDGSLALLGAAEQLRVLAPDGTTQAFPFEVPQNATACGLAWSPLGRRVVAVSVHAERGKRALVAITAYDLATGQTTAWPTVPVGPPTELGDGLRVFPVAVAFDATGQRLAVGLNGLRMLLVGAEVRSEFSAVAVWDTTTGRELFQATTPAPIRAVTFDPDGRLVAGGGTASEGRLTGWDTEARTEVYSFLVHTRPVTALAFGPDRRLATASADKTVKVWDFDARTELLTLDGHRRAVTQLVWTPDRRLVSATGLDLTEMMLTQGDLVARLPPAEVRTWRGGR